MTENVQFRTEDQQPDSLARSVWGVFGILLLLCGALYGPTIAHAAFLGDDWFHIDRIPGERIPHLFSGDWYQGYRHVGGFYRPLPRLVMQCGRLCFDLWAPGYLLLSAALHVINCLLLWVAAMRLTNRPTVAWPAALVFAAYPTHPEGLLQVSTLADLMATCGCLVLLTGYLGVRRSPTVGGWLAVGAGGLLAALSKESWVALPFALVLVEWVWPTGPGRRLPGRSAWVRIGVVVVFAAAYVAFRQAVLGGIGGYGRALSFPSVRYTFDATLRLVLLPVAEIAESELVNAFSLLGGLVVVWALAGFPRLLLFAMGWMVCMTLPLLTLGPKLYDGGRLVYVVAIGWALYLGGVFDRLIGLGGTARSRRAIGLVLTVAVGGPLVLMLQHHCADWRRSFATNDRLVTEMVAIATGHPDAERYAILDWPRRFDAAQSNRPETAAKALSILAAIDLDRIEAGLAPDAPPDTITFAVDRGLRLHAGRVEGVERWVWAGDRLELWRPQGPVRMAHARSDGARDYVFATPEGVLASPTVTGRTGFYSLLLRYRPVRRNWGFIMWRGQASEPFDPSRMVTLTALPRLGEDAQLANPGWLSALSDVLFVPSVDGETLTVRSIEIARFDILRL